MRQDGVVTAIEPWLREILRCPACGSTLRDGTAPEGGPELHCTGCSLAYRVDDGIPVLLVDEGRTRV
jgi:uncharacterized protein YbaR (Trm112 family)